MDVKYIIREIEFLSKLQNERVVRYMKTWIDNNNSLYIQMEFCSDNLKNILKTRELVFKRNDHDHMSNIEYFVSCEIFIEILLAVQYLHDLNPPIIHRDLKPANILFDEQGENGVFFKLCDFGLAKLYEGNTQTKQLGTPKYLAPEVWDGHYDTKADIYSLSVIGHDIFQLDNN